MPTRFGPRPGAASRAGRFGCLFGAIAAVSIASAAPPVATAPTLHVVGGLAAVNQFTRHESPFWNTELARLSAGRYKAEVVPFDRAGIRPTEMMTLVQLGVVPFGTVLMASGASKEPELAAPDLAGLNGIELLAIYVYPAQVVFCNKPWSGLDGLKGRRVRTSGPSQSDWVEALGGMPVATSFAEIVSNLRAGSIDCAITGTMSGNTIGLPELTTHINAMAVSWGLSMFVANAAAWSALPADLQALLRRELPHLESDIWEESARETDAGLACNIGASSCAGGRPAHLSLVASTALDEQRRKTVFASTVLPRWLQRCGASCAAIWNRTLAQTSGVVASVPSGNSR